MVTIKMGINIIYLKELYWGHFSRLPVIFTAYRSFRNVYICSDEIATYDNYKAYIYAHSKLCVNVQKISSSENMFSSNWSVLKLIMAWKCKLRLLSCYEYRFLIHVTFFWQRCIWENLSEGKIYVTLRTHTFVC